MIADISNSLDFVSVLENFNFGLESFVIVERLSALVLVLRQTGFYFILSLFVIERGRHDLESEEDFNLIVDHLSL